MTPRSLFNIILKIFGIFFLREIVITIPQFLSSLVYFINGDAGSAILTVIIFAMITTLYSLLVFQLLFKTNKFIDWLKLDQGFDEDRFSFEHSEKFNMNISDTLVLTIALIVTGGIILIGEIPNFCRQVYTHVEERDIRFKVNKPDMSNIIFTVVKIILGLLILGERKRIVGIILGQQYTAETEEENAQEMEQPD